MALYPRREKIFLNGFVSTQLISGSQKGALHAYLYKHDNEQPKESKS
jgi:hypothetical protein